MNVDRKFLKISKKQNGTMKRVLTKDFLMLKQLWGIDWWWKKDMKKVLDG